MIFKLIQHLSKWMKARTKIDVAHVILVIVDVNNFIIDLRAISDS